VYESEKWFLENKAGVKTRVRKHKCVNVLYLVRERLRTEQIITIIHKWRELGRT
jgi:hypothetical protein